VCCVYSLVTGVCKWLPNWDFTSLHVVSTNVREDDRSASTLDLAWSSNSRYAAPVARRRKLDSTFWWLARPGRPAASLLLSQPEIGVDYSAIYHPVELEWYSEYLSEVVSGINQSIRKVVIKSGTVATLCGAASGKSAAPNLCLSDDRTADDSAADICRGLLFPLRRSFEYKVQFLYTCTWLDRLGVARVQRFRVARVERFGIIRSRHSGRML
jgi:hypothetical protein